VLLDRQTGRSAPLLRGVLGTVPLLPTRLNVGLSCRQAETGRPGYAEVLEPSEGGSNWPRQWRREESNRAREDEEGEEGSIDGTLGMSKLRASPVVSRYPVPEGHGGASLTDGAAVT
jgi:hypothetical protein